MSGSPFAKAFVGEDTARARLDRAHAERLCDGHFPNEPLLPGASVLGLMAEMAGMLLAKRGGPEKLAEVVSASFLVPMRPAADLDLHARLEGRAGGDATVDVEAHSDGRLAARARLRFA